MKVMIEQENIKFCNDCRFFERTFENNFKINNGKDYKYWDVCKLDLFYNVYYDDEFASNIIRPKNCIEKYGE